MSPCPCRHCGGSGIEPGDLDGRDLVRVIFDLIGALAFTTNDLLALASADPESPLSPVLRGHGARQIGWVLRRAVDQNVDGLALQQIGKGRVATWCIAAVSAKPQQSLVKPRE